MRHRMRPLLMVALVLVALFTLNFAMRGVRHLLHLRERPEEPIQAWMNIPYISHSYHIPPEAIHEAIGLPLDQRDRRPLWRIAQDQGRPPEELILAINEAIERARTAPRPPRPDGAPAPPPPPPRPTERTP